MTTLASDKVFMSMALEEAHRSRDMNEVPIGAILVINNKIVSHAHNMPISQNDPTSHAEINVLRKAAKKIGNYRLTGATLYVTLEPCIMCYGAIVHSRISRLVFGACDSKKGICSSSIKLHEHEYFNHTPLITGGVMKDECSLLLKDFFRDKRS